MYTQPYIPRRDETFQHWAAKFTGNISGDCARYGLAPAQAQSLVQAYDRFEAAFQLANNKLTRTAPVILAKQNARSILEGLCRAYAALIRANQGISDEDKVAIGVPPRNTSHRRRTCPQTSPWLNYLGSTPGLDELGFRDTATPDSKAKPHGAERIELWVAYTIAGEPQPKHADARFVGSYKKNSIIVARDPEQEARGARPTYWARWAGFDGGVGPWSLPVSLASAIIAGARAHAAAKINADEDQPIQAPRLAA